MIMINIFGANYSYAKECLLFVSENMMQTVPGHQGGFRNTILNLTDGDGNSASLFGFSPLGGSRFELAFERNMTVDRIVIVNGEEGNANAYYVREMNGTAYERQGTNDTSVLKGVIALSNDRSRQTVVFDRPVSAARWVFEILTVHAPDGAPGAGLCALSEIEFWNRGEKYTVANMDQARRDFIAYTASNTALSFRRYLETVNGAALRDDGVLARWSGAGVETGRIDWTRKKDRTILYLEFTRETNSREPAPQSVLSGTIRAGTRNAALRKREDRATGMKSWHFRESVELADWSVDIWGILWVRVGKGEWKMETGPFLSFQGTDLEDLALTGKPDFAK